MTSFDKVHIEISNICNLQCSFCPEVIRQKQMMDLDLFTSIIEQVAPMTKQVAFHLMGDPLVHPRLIDFVEVCHRHQVRIFMVTNGVLLRPAHCELLLHPAFRQINFSLHSFFDNYPERDPKSYLDRIFSFTEQALETRPDLYINYRLWNLQDPRGSGSANNQMLQLVVDHYQIKTPDKIDVTRKKSYLVKGRLYLHFDTEFTWPSVDLPLLGERGRCYGLKSHFGVLVDGTVVPCCLDKEGVISLGDAKTQSLAVILQNPRAQQMLQGFNTNKLVEELCKRCQYIERFGRA